MRRLSFAMLILTGLAVLAFGSPLALADACLGPIARGPLTAPDGTRILLATLKSDEVRITYVGHSTFTIESPGGVVAATDYNDYVRPRLPPTIATMNHAHSTHYTHRPDPAIRHVLRGWSSGGKMPSHDLQERDMRVRNVPTNIRAGWSEGSGTEYSGNSIFVFEVAGLCIAHLGHLHHVLTPEHLQAIGKVDVVMVPVDGSWTMDLPGMLEVLNQLSPKIIVPMHYFSESVLGNFLTRLGRTHAVERIGSPTMVLSIAGLPQHPTVRVLEGR